MPTPKSNQSTYAGFLNGYIAGNLSANSQELNFHFEKISHFIKDLNIEINKWETLEQKPKIDELLNGINALSGNKDNIGYYINLGDAIYELISFILVCKPVIPSTTSFILKKIIYHFLNIAKTLKNTNITKQAKRIAEKFDSQ